MCRETETERKGVDRGFFLAIMSDFSIFLFLIFPNKFLIFFRVTKSERKGSLCWLSSCRCWNMTQPIVILRIFNWLNKIFVQGSNLKSEVNFTFIFTLERLKVLGSTKKLVVLRRRFQFATFKVLRWNFEDIFQLFFQHQFFISQFNFF